MKPKSTKKQRIAKLIMEQERDVEEYVKHCPTKAALWPTVFTIKNTDLGAKPKEKRKA